MIMWLEKLYDPHNGQHHLSTIPIKDFNIFKITESFYNIYIYIFKLTKTNFLVKLTQQF